EEAVSLRRGPLLEGCCEEWILQEREAREQAYMAALEALAGQAAARGEHADSVRWLRIAAAADRLRECTQRALMRSLASCGDYAAAVLTYRDLRLFLHRELNADPDPETSALFEELRAEAHARAAVRPPP